MKTYKLKNKKFFRLGGTGEYKIANLFIKRSYTNVFVTLADLDNKVIACVTAGSADTSITNRRWKRAPIAIEEIVIALNAFFRRYNVRFVNIILKMRAKAHVYTLLTKLAYYGLTVLSIKSRKFLAHNGVKGRRLRRL